MKNDEEAVKIDDWVSDIRGSFIGWKDATDETPPDFNGEAYRLIYSKHVDGAESYLSKITSVVGRFLFDAFDNTWAFEVSDNIYPKSAIEGFNGGKTVSGVKHETGTPDKRVILKNDIDGDRPYMERVGPGNVGDSERISDLKDTINNLRQQLEAEQGKTHELEQQVDRDEDSSQRNSYGPEHYDEYDENMGGVP